MRRETNGGRPGAGVYCGRARGTASRGAQLEAVNPGGAVQPSAAPPPITTPVASSNQAASALLLGTSPEHPVAFLVAPLLLGAVAMVAVYAPARRVTRLDPIRALRME